MSEIPRIEFPFFTVSSDPMLEGWRRFRNSVATAVERSSGPRSRLRPGQGQSPGRDEAMFSNLSPRLSTNALPDPLPNALPNRLSDLLPETLSSALPEAPSGLVVPSIPRDEGVGVWRLLAANNREICRSAGIFHTFDEARDDVTYLREHAELLDTVRVIGPRPGMQGWYMRRDDTPVVTCSRWYEVSSSSADAAADVISRLQNAELSLSPRRAAIARRGSGVVVPVVVGPTRSISSL